MEEGHKKYSKVDVSISLKQKQAVDYLCSSVEETVDDRKGACKDLQKLCDICKLRSKGYEVLALFQLNEEEEGILKKLV